MNTFLDALKNKVLLCDGGFGTLLQSYKLDVKTDFLGLENCAEILNQNRPNVVAEIHSAYLSAGADCIETNTFSANKVVLSDFGIADKVYELNLKAAQIARKTADKYSTPIWPRFVIGSIGPGTKLPSLGHISYDELADSYYEQALGLIEGKVDMLLIETQQDLLTVKAAVHACRNAQKAIKKSIPIFAQVTMETTGATLVGSDITAVTAALAAMNIDGIGLNCGLGPVEMDEHITYLCKNWPGFISIMPNAGLPILVDGKTQYLLKPEELAAWHKKFIEQGVHLVGGCCGTNPDHIQAVFAMLSKRESKKPIQRTVSLQPSLSSLFTAIPIMQENAVFTIGERANAHGSKRFRELLQQEDFDGMTAMIREQSKEGSHAVDICTAMVGRSELKDMTQLVSLVRTHINAAIVIDSTNPGVIEAGLKLLGGKSLINSINFENGTEKAEQILKLAKQFGAAVIGLTIDECGMAKTLNEKIKLIKKLCDFIAKHQFPLSDLFIDPLTFTICTGHDDDREHAVQTLAAIEYLSKNIPEAQSILGLSNISFGLKPEARHVLNSVFLHYAQQRGLKAAIIHVSKIMPLHQISEEQRLAAENLIFNRRQNQKDPLLHFIKLFEHAQKTAQKNKKTESIEEILKNHIIEGDKRNLEKHLDIARQKYTPLEIINNYLLDGMKTVGHLFLTGKMQLPFMLKSAETMKKAVAHLEQFMPKSCSHTKGTIILATVKGDVHDIGKNLVDIILTNNGYNVVNLGIKQPIANIIAAAEKHKADAIGMSGLLIHSTVVMKENLEIMKQQGIKTPVILGGAALNKAYVEKDCREAYGEENFVRYAKDAFSAIELMDKIKVRQKDRETIE